MSALWKKQVDDGSEGSVDVAFQVTPAPSVPD